jgi:hypothetical protein
MEQTKRTSKFIILALGAAFTVGLGAINNSQATTADYYKCVSRVGGEYAYGRAPQACNASSFGDDKVVLGNYGKVIFDDGSDRSKERSRYVDEVNAVLKEAATYYLKKRKPSVSTEELNWFILGIQATASHESYWSHYRKASDARIKMMRGDSGHGHGMMQVDDRAHYSAINSGVGWNLVSHLTYAMDIFYTAWEKAPSQSCVRTATNYQARVRSAWSAYNGGIGKICRWTNSSDKWAQNDKNFYTHLSKRMWESYVVDKNKASSVNVACLVEKKENCPAPSTQPDVNPVLTSGVLYQTTSGRYCVVSNNKASCVAEFRDAMCLKAVGSYTSNDPTTVTDAALNTYSPVVLNRHTLCAQYDSTLYAVGTKIEILKNTNLRATPGGGALLVIPANQVLEVKDFELRTAPTNERYYQVTYSSKTGYIYAGTKSDYQSWAVVKTNPTSPGSLAEVGESVKVVSAQGINMRSTPGGTLQKLVPKNTQLKVLEVYVDGSNNKAYYKVNYAGLTGYIYTGLLLPTDTTGEWTTVLP